MSNSTAGPPWVRVLVLSGAAAMPIAAFAQDPAPPPSGGNQTFPGLMNPAISVNGLFLAGLESDDGEVVKDGAAFGTGLQVQEIEVQFLAAVDPYFKANIVLSVPGSEGLEVEEGYVTLTSVRRLLVNVGKIKEPFGRENQTHTHALLTIDKSLVGQRIFGEEGLNDMGVNAAWLVPVPWYSELTIGVDGGNNEVVLGSGDPYGLGTMAHWKNLFDLARDTTVEVGASGLTGMNAYDGRSVVAGGDLTLKSRGHGRHQWDRLVWQSEYLYADVPGAPVDERIGGLYSTLEGSFSHRFWLGGRFDAVGFPGDDPTFGATAIAVLVPTEFSGVRLQAQRQFLPGGHTADSVVAQLDFTLGTHPAHSY